MASIHYVILFSIVYLYVYALICRICKCIEHCATARAYSKLRENGVMTKMSDVEAGPSALCVRHRSCLLLLRS